jgi:transcriptional regulator with XRE-family HTH domain
VTALAERAGIARPHLSAYEAGRVAIAIDTLGDLAAALDVDPLALTSAQPGEE